MNRILKLVGYGLVSALLIFALTQLDLTQLLKSITRIPLLTLAILACLQLVSLLLVNLQWHQVANRCAARLSFRDMFYINCQGAVIDSITPGVKIGGEVTRAVLIGRMGKCSGEEAAAVVAVQKLFSLSVFFFICLFAAGIIISDLAMFQAGRFQLIIYGFLFFFLMLFSCSFIFTRRILVFLKNRWEDLADAERGNSEISIGGTPPKKKNRIRSFLIALFEGLIIIRKNKKLLFVILLLSFIIWLLYPAKIYLLTMQMHNEAHIAVIGAAVFAAYLVAMLPIFPGGLGGYEATLSWLLLASGFLQSDAVAIAIVFRFFTFWLVMLFSLGYIGFSKVMNNRDVVPESRRL